MGGGGDWLTNTITVLRAAARGPGSPGPPPSCLANPPLTRVSTNCRQSPAMAVARRTCLAPGLTRAWTDAAEDNQLRVGPAGAPCELWTCNN